MGVYQNYGEKVGLNIKVQVKDETARVLAKAAQAEKRTLNRIGAYLRGIARRSIRRGKKYADPGRPPRTRKGNLKDAIVFATTATHSVVIGPTANRIGRLGATHEFGGIEGPKPGAKPNFILEVGGHGPIRNMGGVGGRDKKGRFLTGPHAGLVFAKLMSVAQVARSIELARQLPPTVRGGGAATDRRYPKRAFMGPALAAGRAKTPQFFANSI